MRGQAGLFLALLFVTPVASAQVPAATTPGPAPQSSWKPFNELAWLVGHWAGTASSGARIGGRVARFTMELGGHYLMHRGSTVFPAEEGRLEETFEEVGWWSYDRERRMYVASYCFSTGVSGRFDVEVASDGAVRLVAPALQNYETGARARLTLRKAGDTGLDISMDIAPAGKDFVAYQTSSLKRK